MSTLGDQQQQPPTQEQGQDPPAEIRVSRASTITTAGGRSMTCSLRSGTKTSPRRELFEYLIDTDHQLLLTLSQAEKAHKDLCKFDFSNRYSQNSPKVMIWYQTHLTELHCAKQQLDWSVRTAQTRLEMLIEVGDIRKGTLMKPQPRKYTKTRMEEEVKQQQEKLTKIQETLDMAEVAFAKVFAKWLNK